MFSQSEYQGGTTSTLSSPAIRLHGITGSTSSNWRDAMKSAAVENPASGSRVFTVGNGRTLSALKASCSQGQDLVRLEPSQGPPAQHLPDARDQQGETEEVGKEARRQQQDAGYENHHAVCEGTGRKPALVEIGLRLSQRSPSLSGNKRGADDCGQHDDGDRRRHADASANGDEQHHLYDRNDQEQQEKGRKRAHRSENTGVGNLRHMGLRDLPSIDALTDRLAAGAASLLPLPVIRAMARDAIDEARRELQGGREVDPESLARPRVERLAALRPTRVINATGVLLHTNLGRAPVAASAVDAGAVQKTGYGNLEFDLTTGARGGRGAYLSNLLTTQTGAESALVVNNNAAALLLTLMALAAPGTAVVSRGELIEIGGSFRLPELMAASGAAVTEVGTTNRTRVADYAAALPAASLLLKVHPSNYRIEGFSEETGYRELADLARAHDVPLVADVGSGLLDTRTPWLDGPPPSWLSDEPGVRQTLEAGADIVLFSGDKLLGGPQAGMAVGRRDLIDAMKRHPVARATRIDGATGAVLAATLELYASGRGSEIPFWRMASAGYEDLRARHEVVLSAAGAPGAVVAAESVPGAGSVPGEAIPSPAIRLETTPDPGWKHLIASEPPIVSRRRDGALFLDLRTVEPEDDPHISAALRALP